MLSVSTNLPVETKCFIRKTSESQSGLELIAEFINHLWSLEELYHQSIPQEIHDAIERLERETDVRNKFSKDKTLKNFWKSSLKKYIPLPCFGFNSGKHIDYMI